MTDREKLIELIVTTPVPCMVVSGVRGGKSLISASVIADHLLANGVTFAKDTDVPSKWISVEDRLPEDDVQVLACTKHGKAFSAHCENGRWRVSGSVKITHWMPLPEPPKEVSHG